MFITMIEDFESILKGIRTTEKDVYGIQRALNAKEALQ